MHQITWSAVTYTVLHAVAKSILYCAHLTIFSNMLIHPTAPCSAPLICATQPSGILCELHYNTGSAHVAPILLPLALRQQNHPLLKAVLKVFVA